jgi:hypothetical protein
MLVFDHNKAAIKTGKSVQFSPKSMSIFIRNMLSPMETLYGAKFLKYFPGHLGHIQKSKLKLSTADPLYTHSAI